MKLSSSINSHQPDNKKMATLTAVLTKPVIAPMQHRRQFSLNKPSSLGKKAVLLLPRAGLLEMSWKSIALNVDDEG